MFSWQRMKAGFENCREFAILSCVLRHFHTKYEAQGKVRNFVFLKILLN